MSDSIELIRSLKDELLKTADKLDKYKNIVDGTRIIGSHLSTLGSVVQIAGMCMAPLTGGASVLVSSAAAAGGMAAGGSSALLTRWETKAMQNMYCKVNETVRNIQQPDLMGKPTSLRTDLILEILQKLAEKCCPTAVKMTVEATKSGATIRATLDTGAKFTVQVTGQQATRILADKTGQETVKFFTTETGQKWLNVTVEFVGKNGAKTTANFAHAATKTNKALSIFGKAMTFVSLVLSVYDIYDAATNLYSGTKSDAAIYLRKVASTLTELMTSM